MRCPLPAGDASVDADATDTHTIPEIKSLAALSKKKNYITKKKRQENICLSAFIFLPVLSR
jgi:hypothetical protein